MSATTFQNKSSKDINLRQWILEDLPIYKKWHQGHHKWMDLDGPYYAKPNPEELGEALGNLKEMIETESWMDPLRSAVVADLKTNRLLGTVGWYWQSEETNWKSIGLVLYEEGNWGKGIGYQALELWIDYLFQADPQLVRLDLRTWSGNKGMIRLGEKLGFLMEARFRKARIVKGQYFDGIGMGILREEWENRSS